MAVDQKAHRRYHATIERALTLFDVNSDWADYIAFLSRLLKSLEAGKPDDLTDVPCKVRIALCLSRCLQPQLPSGVHQKALDVYNEVFSIIGLPGLARDLSLYLPGLSHTLAFANLATRPLVLDLFEEYILRLSTKSLRPALKALILSLLPIIEEVSSEDFDRCLRTFDALRLAYAAQRHESYFWQCLFVASISNPLRRPGVLVYMNQYLPKLTSVLALDNVSGSETVTNGASSSDVITNPEPGLLMRCFATGLRDDQSLVQRGFLDLLVTHLPLNATILQSERYRKDLDVLVTAAMMIVLRRDMGLNRRLWAWYTGSDGKADIQVTSPLEHAQKQLDFKNEHFKSFGLEPTIRSIDSLLKDQTLTPTSRTIPFRIATSLLDRWDIGAPVVKASFPSMMRILLTYQSTAPTQAAFDDVFRSASTFFDGIETPTLFECLGDIFKQGEIDLVAFIIANFNLEKIDMARIHICQFSSVIATSVISQQEDQSVLILLLSDVMAVVTPANTHLREAEVEAANRLLGDVGTILANALLEPINQTTLSLVSNCYEQAIGLGGSIRYLFQGLPLETLQISVHRTLNASSPSFTNLESLTRIFESFMLWHSDLDTKEMQTCLNCIPALIEGLWRFLDTSTPQYHVAVVEHLWRLQDVTSEYKIVESTILKQFGPGFSVRAFSSDQVERFGVFFHHTRTIKRTSEDAIPGMLQATTLRVLDNTSGDEKGESGVQWLMSLQNVSPVVGLILSSHSTDSQTMSLTLYRIQKLVRIMNLSEDHWRAFSSSPDLSTVRDFCLGLIQTNSQNASKLTHDAFSLLGILYGDRSGNIPPEELVLALVDMLADTTKNFSEQEEVLDALLAILNDKSMLPSSLVNVLLQGVLLVPIDERLDKWITLLCNFLPNHSALLPSLLKTTSNFCKRIDQVFEDLQSVFNEGQKATKSKSPERSIVNLLSGLEYVLARAHQQVTKGLMSNGATSESTSSRSRANDRLTVVLCMQDAVRVCTKLWSWKTVPRADGGANSRIVTGDMKSFQYSAIKLRSRSRKMLENLIEAEPQESLETLIGIWALREQNSVLDLLQTLNGARPRSMIPAVFNAIYSRTNPGALNSSQKSSLSIPTTPTQLMLFLNEYTTALEDDMLEEIWSDCANFLREVLSNPMPHRQILIKLLIFCSVLSRKMENTNFTEESRMHRELAEICARLFTAIFTIKPVGFDGPNVPVESRPKNPKDRTSSEEFTKDDNMLVVLVKVLPDLGPLMGQLDRISSVYSVVSTNITSPSLHARVFPSNITLEHLEIMRLMSTSAGVSKIWKKDMIDSFSNPRFFQSPLTLVEKGWLPLLRQLQVNEKLIVAECLARIAPPAAAGIMFGVGATAARNEADRRTQLDLRRTASLIMASESDSSLAQLPQMIQKVEELFGATAESSPSIAVRGDVYLLVRALLLRIDHAHLSALWPILDKELQDLCKDIMATSESKYSGGSKIQGAKLLDLLLLMRPDEFQLHEWLFITDTIDAIYPSVEVQPVAFADEIAAILSAKANGEPHSAMPNNPRRPWLYSKGSLTEKETDGLLAGFFSQLSIRAFEDLYSLMPLDEAACTQSVLRDIFSDLIA